MGNLKPSVWVKYRHPFEIVAMVVMPDPLHAVRRLPSGDAKYPQRWSLIKVGFSRGIPKDERIRPSRIVKREGGIWQRRYLEHLLLDDQDIQVHIDYILHNPVKPGYVVQASAWPHSSIHRYIRMGCLKEDTGSRQAGVWRRVKREASALSAQAKMSVRNFYTYRVRRLCCTRNQMNM